jgi:H+/Cl- antiporter ClcA
MNESTPPRNPHTHQLHRRETFWQITLPLILGGLVMLGLSIWAIVAAAGGGNVNQAASASLIFLIIPTMFMALFVLLILAGLAYLVIQANHGLPPVMRKIQGFFVRVREAVRLYSDKLVEPILRAQSGIAALKSLKRNQTTSSPERPHHD